LQAVFGMKNLSMEYFITEIKGISSVKKIQQHKVKCRKIIQLNVHKLFITC
jgi:hypothetical protein